SVSDTNKILNKLDFQDRISILVGYSPIQGSFSTSILFKFSGIIYSSEKFELGRPSDLKRGLANSYTCADFLLAA
ncbi:MAG: hypothetical protein OXC62_10765, partial [Aestuariivita sp.]|nr:hypothetical protein [Aestuariivita sp.]